jgi:hypothetical protein
MKQCLLWDGKLIFCVIKTNPLLYILESQKFFFVDVSRNEILKF